MSIWQFVFSFLYARNWYTGEMELSIPRIVLFLGMVGLVLLGVAIAFVLQAPISYNVS